MGLLGNILSGAISDGIGKAVGKAVEKAVTPAAERMAEKQAEAIDKVTEKTEQAIAEQEAAQADGTQKPMTPEEKEKAEQAAQALKGLGMMFSGAIAMAKKEQQAEEAARQAAETAIFENWETELGAYPKWDVGGSRFELEELTPMNGYPAFSLRLTGRPYLVELYAAKLRSAGFIAMHCSNPGDLNADTYYKMIDGVCRAFNRTDACNDGHINVTFYVDNYVPKPAAERKPVSGDTDLSKLAKGIFKKLF